MRIVTKSPNLPWKEWVAAAVSPLESGVQPLAVNGYRPPGGAVYRPGRTAAVLVPLMDLEEPQVVFTRRAEHLVQHPGQVSFPGGAAEKEDDSAVQTALREAFEEIGLQAEQTRPIGFLDRMDTISDYRVLPVVAFVEGQVDWIIDASEVAEVFTVPLEFVLNKENYSKQSVQRDGKNLRLWSMRWEQHHIWGATASMLLNLIGRMEKVREH